MTIPAGKSSQGFTINTSQVQSTSACTVFATANSTTLKASLTVTPLPVQSLTLSPASIVGGHSLTGTVTLGMRAPTNGAVIQVSSDQPFVVVPSTVTVKASYLTATFALKTTAVSTSQTATVTGGTGATTSKDATLIVNPPGVQSVTLTGGVVKPGTTVSGTATLQSPAPAGGVLIKLSRTPPMRTFRRA